MTAEFYTKDKPTIQAYLKEATVGIKSKDKDSGKTTINPYIGIEGRILVAIDTWNPPDPTKYEMRILPSYEIIPEINMIIATATLEFRPRESDDEGLWSPYYRNYSSETYQKVNNDNGQTYNVAYALEKAISGAITRVLGTAGIGTGADEADINTPAGTQQQVPAQSNQQQRQAPAPQQQSAPAAAPKKPVDPWTPPFAKLDDKAKAHVRKTILNQVEASEDDLDGLIDTMLKANPNTTGNEILAEATSG